MGDAAQWVVTNWHFLLGAVVILAVIAEGSLTHYYD
jgi:hypothetical protein